MDVAIPALELQGLSKTYKRPAVDELSLTVPTGGIYALLGPNGAGKTTTLRMVTGLVKPDYGAIKVLGIDALADPIGAKRLMAWLPDEPMLYDALTAMEYLEFVAGLWSVPSALAAERARITGNARPLAQSQCAVRRLFARHEAKGRPGRGLDP